MPDADPFFDGGDPWAKAAPSAHPKPPPKPKPVDALNETDPWANAKLGVASWQPPAAPGAGRGSSSANKMRSAAPSWPTTGPRGHPGAGRGGSRGGGPPAAQNMQLGNWFAGAQPAPPARTEAPSAASGASAGRGRGRHLIVAAHRAGTGLSATPDPAASSAAAAVQEPNGGADTAAEADAWADMAAQASGAAAAAAPRADGPGGAGGAAGGHGDAWHHAAQGGMNGTAAWHGWSGYAAPSGRSGGSYDGQAAQDTHSRGTLRSEKMDPQAQWQSVQQPGEADQARPEPAGAGRAPPPFGAASAQEDPLAAAWLAQAARGGPAPRHTLAGVEVQAGSDIKPPGPGGWLACAAGDILLVACVDAQQDLLYAKAHGSRVLQQGEASEGWVPMASLVFPNPSYHEFLVDMVVPAGCATLGIAVVPLSTPCDGVAVMDVRPGSLVHQYNELMRATFPRDELCTGDIITSVNNEGGAECVIAKLRRWRSERRLELRVFRLAAWQLSKSANGSAAPRDVLAAAMARGTEPPSDAVGWT